MKKQQPKTLDLKRHTLRPLVPEQLQQIAGGRGQSDCNCGGTSTNGVCN